MKTVERMGYVFLAAAICIFGLMFSQGADGQAPQGPLVRDPLEAGGHWESSLSQADFVAIGEAIYMTKGSNTCHDCHGKDGTRGRLVQAANLTAPSTWLVSKALCGDQPKIEHALTYLLIHNAHGFNKNYIKDHPEAGWDWSKTGESAYDIQAFGLSQTSTKLQIKMVQRFLKTKGVAVGEDQLFIFGARAVLAYLSTISREEPGQAFEVNKCTPQAD